jgi:hypothetical protein
MGFSAMHRTRIRPGALRELGRTLALFGVIAGAGTASAEAIPGPPLAISAGDLAGAVCPPRGSVRSSAAGFAAGVAIVAIAARRREPRA